MNRVKALTAKTVDTLGELLRKKKHPQVRLGAPRTVAELSRHQYYAKTICAAMVSVLDGAEPVGDAAQDGAQLEDDWNGCPAD